MRILKKPSVPGQRCLKNAVAICGILLSALDARAAVIYYQPAERIRLSNLNPATQDYNIDLDGDDVFDLQHDSVGRATFLRTWEGTRILGLQQPFGGGSWYDSQPYALPQGTLIGADSPSLYPEFGNLSGWWAQPPSVPGVASLHVRYDTGTSGFFVGTRGFIGIEFLINEETHYGWIDLDNYSWWQSEIHGWAYESEPNKPIMAGAIPEPCGMLLASAGAAGLTLRRRRKAS